MLARLHAVAERHMAIAFKNAILTTMQLPRYVRTLLLLIALAFGVASTSATFACAPMVGPSAMAAMPADHCRTDDSGTPANADHAAPCALACPTGCLMALPVGTLIDGPHFGARFDAARNAPRLIGEVWRPEPPRPRMLGT